MTEPPLLQATGLVKSYGDRRVVDGLDITCREAQVVGLLGSNGAGKTTTLRMLYGFIATEAGSITYDGLDFGTHRLEAKRWIGVCTQEDTLDYDFSVRRNLEVYARYFRPVVDDLEQRIDDLLTQFGLQEYADASPHALSGGYKRRLLIARSVVHKPRILFLDEPTTGLDPKARVDVWTLIHGLRKEGLGIILTTHYMDEAERLSDELVILSKGKVLVTGTTKDVLGEALGEHVLVVPPDEPEAEAIEEWALSATGNTPMKILGELHLPVQNAELALFTQRFEHARFEVRTPTLDDLFLKISDETENPEDTA